MGIRLILRGMLSGLLILMVATARAEWMPNGTVIAGASYDQRNSQIVPDGYGGAIITWEGTWCDTGQWNVYAQRVDALGDIHWGLDGLLICSESRGYGLPSVNDPIIVAGGLGEAIIAWRDQRTYPSGVYTQKIDIDGNVLWESNGVVVADSCSVSFLTMVSDGSEGAIITWNDDRSGSMEIYAQKISSTGIPQWGDNGVKVSYTDEPTFPIITTDMAGGAILAWRADNVTFDVYAQRVDSLGNLCWGEDGVNVTDPLQCNLPDIASNGDGGAIIAWRSGYVPGIGREIYAQNIDRDGNKLWGATALTIYSYNGIITVVIVVPTPLGGGIVFWSDDRNGNYDIFAQEIDDFGVPQWDSGGIPICSALETQYQFKAIPSGLGGAIVTWVDLRHGDRDIYAQKVDESGNALWQVDGVGICTAAISDQIFPQIITDAANGAIISWDDHRLGQYDIYAQKVGSNGFVVTDAEAPPQPLALYQNYPNPFNPTTMIRYLLPRDSKVKLSIHDVAGREVACLVDGYQSEGRYSIDWNAKNRLGNQVSSGIYFYRLRAGNMEVTRKMVLLR